MYATRLSATGTVVPAPSATVTVVPEPSAMHHDEVNEEKSSSKLWLWIVIISVALVGVIIMMVVLLGGGHSYNTDPTYLADRAAKLVEKLDNNTAPEDLKSEIKGMVLDAAEIFGKNYETHKKFALEPAEQTRFDEFVKDPRFERLGEIMDSAHEESGEFQTKIVPLLFPVVVSLLRDSEVLAAGKTFASRCGVDAEKLQAIDIVSAILECPGVDNLFAQLQKDRKMQGDLIEALKEQGISDFLKTYSQYIIPALQGSISNKNVLSQIGKVYQVHEIEPSFQVVRAILESDITRDLLDLLKDESMLDRLIRLNDDDTDDDFDELLKFVSDYRQQLVPIIFRILKDDLVMAELKSNYPADLQQYVSFAEFKTIIDSPEMTNFVNGLAAADPAMFNDVVAQVRDQVNKGFNQKALTSLAAKHPTIGALVTTHILPICAKVAMAQFK